MAAMRYSAKCETLLTMATTKTTKTKDPQIDANIFEPDGTYYPVKLKWLPREGDHVRLYSFTDNFVKTYRVLAVLHDIHEVAKAIWQSHDGSHFVNIYVLEAPFIYDDKDVAALAPK
jgi:hypothetical protein